MPTIRDDLGAAAAACPTGQAGTCVYVAGGDNGVVVSTFEAYNQRTNAWSTLPSMPTARESVAAAAAPCPFGQAGTCIYAAGGALTTTNTGYVTTLEAYRPAGNTWTTLAPMPTAREEAGAAAAPCPLGQAGTCVYVAGGRNGAGALKTLESYNPRTNSWTSLTGMPTAREDLGAAAAPCPPSQTGTCVYAVGGETTAATALNTNESYNPRTNTWTSLTGMPTAREGLGVASGLCPSGQTGTCVYAVAGETGGTDLNVLEAFTPR
jgi:hypothetical protein